MADIKALTGDETLTGSTGNDNYIVDVDVDTGIKTLLDGGGVDTLDFSDSSATVSVDLTQSGSQNIATGVNLILGSSAIENLTGGKGNDILTGNTAANTIDGGVGADLMSGLAGDDTYIVDNVGDIVSEAVNGSDASGTDTVKSSVSYTLSSFVENIILTGGDNINATGNDLANNLTGNGGNNTLDGGTGTDTMAGGAGNDTYIVDNTGDMVTESADSGMDTMISSVTYSLTTSVENLILSGTLDINGTGNSLANRITGNAGANTLDGGAGIDIMTGGAGDDVYIVDDNSDRIIERINEGTDTVKSSATNYVLSDHIEKLELLGTTENINGTGNASANTITGNSGNNTLDGKTGADTLIGGAGNDTYIVDHTSDVVTEAASEGTDTVLSSVTYTLSNDVENLTLVGNASVHATGNSLNNTIKGNNGANTLNGGAGVDTMEGGIGNDTYIVDNTGDVVTETEKGGTVDTVLASVSYTLGNFIENLNLTGTDNINATGNSLRNFINGNSGNNTIDAGAGADVMKGGAGNDTYIVDNIGDSVSETAAGDGTDTVISSVNHTLGNFIENLELAPSFTFALEAGSGADAGKVFLKQNNVKLAGDEGTPIVLKTNTNLTLADGKAVTLNQGSKISFRNGAVSAIGSVVISRINSSDFGSITLAKNINATGNSLNNVLTGNSSDNILDGKSGADTMAGGAGDDTYIVDNTGDVVTEAASAGTDTIKSSVTYVLSGGAADVENLTLTGTDSINATGNSLVNIIIGNNGNNTIDGGAGADSMAGGRGNDTYIVDNTGDVVTELFNSGTDTIQSSVTYALSGSAANVENLTLTGTDNLNATGNNLANTITGNSGNNTIDGGAGKDTMAGDAGDDTYYVDDSGDVITEGSGAGTDQVFSTAANYTLSDNIEKLTLVGGTTDALRLQDRKLNGTGYTGANTIIGNAADNIIDGGGGADSMAGGYGNDTYVVDNTGDVIVEVDDSASFTVGTKTYTLRGGVDTVRAAVSYTLTDRLENMTLIGTDNINATGNSLKNVLIGNTANNTLDGVTGEDVMIGSKGDDTYIVNSTGDVVTELTNEGTDTVRSSITYTLGNNVENLTLTGSASLNGTGNNLANTIEGNSGNNTLDGKGGGDTMKGGAGDDTYIVDNTGDVIQENGSEGTDLVRSSVTYTLAANVENLILTGKNSVDATGNSLDNIITGNAANNTLSGGAAGNDKLSGAGGNDTYLIDGDTDTGVKTIEELSGGGTDTIDFSSTDNTVNVTLNLASTSSQAIGSGGLSLILPITSIENVTGGAGNDTLTGNALANRLIGGAGADTLNGGAGADRLTGGDGNDNFVFGSSGVTQLSQMGVDTITDFSSGDKIQLSLAAFGALTATGVLDATKFATVNSDAAAAGEAALIVYNTVNGNLFYNADGVTGGFGTNGGRFAILTGAPTLAASSIEVIS
jgi:Ca2+-binding RTX toxin-like protein